MKTTLLEPYGYCPGVRRALMMALAFRKERPGREMIVLGMLVHNEDAIRDLEAAGIKTLERPGHSFLELIDEVPAGALVILGAHGHTKAVEEKLLARGLAFLDTTCPKVTAVFRLIEKTVTEGKNVIYLGRAGHPEALAACSISPLVFLYEGGPFPFAKLQDEEPLIVSQTTLSEEEVKTKTAFLLQRLPRAKILPTVCLTSLQRQKALLDLPKDADLIYVVGSERSNNTRTLYKLAKASHPQAAVIAVRDVSDLREEDFKDKRHAVIVTGASTPGEKALKIKERLLAV